MSEKDKTPMERFEDLSRKIFQVPKEQIEESEPIEEQPEELEEPSEETDEPTIEE